MKKAKTYSEKITIEQDGLLVQGWRKRCVCCGKTYETTSRSQKFCSDACCKKANTKRRRQKKEYNESIDIQRLSARAHAVAVATMEYLAKTNVVEKKCACCGSLDNLQVHHINVSFLDNRPDNLQWLCTKCHSEAHSKIQDTYRKKYSDLESCIYNQILKS